jgi:thiosulfate/3-mercaptopyruvate sulfurtransferase
MSHTPNPFGPVVSIAQMNALRGDDSFLLIDVRGGVDAVQRYAQGHLAGAVFVDLETELSDKRDDPKIGGRHPLPSPLAFCEFLGGLGVTQSSKIVVYDDKQGALGAARFWWMVRAIGHQAVAVLDGGYQAAVNRGESISTDTVVPRPTTFRYSADNWTLSVCKIEDVELAIANRSAVIIDVRETYRYLGESEPIDLLAGHIPSAVNMPYLNNMDRDGMLLPATQLRNRFLEMLTPEQLSNAIIHCGSGVSACHTLLALELAKLPLPRLYVGSWSEWSRQGRTISIGNEN